MYIQEKKVDITVRKRKKGQAGKKEGIDAYRILAWTTLDIRKYAETLNKEVFISLQLNWTEDEKDFLGKGAVLNGKITIEEPPDEVCILYTVYNIVQYSIA